MARSRQLREFAYPVVVVFLMAATLLVARLQASEFSQWSNSHSVVRTLASHAKKQSLSYKSQFQSAVPTHVFRILPRTETCVAIRIHEVTRARLSLETSLYNRPPPRG